MPDVANDLAYCGSSKQTKQQKQAKNSSEGEGVEKVPESALFFFICARDSQREEKQNNKTKLNKNNHKKKKKEVEAGDVVGEQRRINGDKRKFMTLSCRLECQATRLIGCWGFPLYPLIPLCGKPRVFSRRQWVPRKLFPLACKHRTKKKEHTKRKEGSVSHSGGWE
ncbi:hypothetical protein CEXT_755501 [Caerostris extrusa]|uniref:Uncharacterized protein n=1 Tax=Caerostris extrusa TaxID=172846 RepID=A0AAV4P0Y9_CAEEX|nr:hypothetical protein CEXT_755501 [Caerostris extrusa]